MNGLTCWWCGFDAATHNGTKPVPRPVSIDCLDATIFSGLPVDVIALVTVVCVSPLALGRQHTASAAARALQAASLALFVTSLIIPFQGGFPLPPVIWCVAAVRAELFLATIPAVQYSAHSWTVRWLLPLLWTATAVLRLLSLLLHHRWPYNHQPWTNHVAMAAVCLLFAMTALQLGRSASLFSWTTAAAKRQAEWATSRRRSAHSALSNEGHGHGHGRLRGSINAGSQDVGVIGYQPNKQPHMIRRTFAHDSTATHALEQQPPLPSAAGQQRGRANAAHGSVPRHSNLDCNLHVLSTPALRVAQDGSIQPADAGSVFDDHDEPTAACASGCHRAYEICDATAADNAAASVSNVSDHTPLLPKRSGRSCGDTAKRGSSRGSGCRVGEANARSPLSPASATDAGALAGHGNSGNPEDGASLFGRLFFTWMWPTLRSGYKHSGLVPRLVPTLSFADTSKHLHVCFQKQATPKTGLTTGPTTLISASVAGPHTAEPLATAWRLVKQAHAAAGRLFHLSALMVLISTAASFGAPFIMKELLDELEHMGHGTGPGSNSTTTTTPTATATAGSASFTAPATATATAVTSPVAPALAHMDPTSQYNNCSSWDGGWIDVHHPCVSQASAATAAWLLGASNASAHVPERCQHTTVEGARAYGLAVALFLCAVLQSVCEHQFWTLGQRCALHIRTMLMSAVYTQILHLPAAAFTTLTGGYLANVLLVDASRVFDTFVIPNLHWGTWCSVLILTVALYFLTTYLGVAALCGLGMFVVTWPAALLVARVMKRYSAAVQQLRDSRAQSLQAALAMMRVVKAYCWEDWLESVVTRVRAREIAFQRRKQLASSVLNFVVVSGRVLAPCLSFLAFAFLNQHTPLKASTAFACLTWYNLLRRPMAFLPNAITNSIDVAVSWRRIASLLAYPTHEELTERQQRLMGTRAHGPSPLRARATAHALAQPHAPSPRLQPLHSSLHAKHPHGLQPRHHYHTSHAPPHVLLSRVTATWNGDLGERAVLEAVDFEARAGELVVVTGPLGSGKSSLLSAVTRDVFIHSGEVHTRGRIAVVPQNSWVQAASIRDNIVFGAEFRPRWYQSVIAACSLRGDLDSLPAGDETVLEDDGTNISGGQRQRIALARAAYARPDIVLLDDVLASLDAATAMHVLDHCICGLLGKTTRVLVTHSAAAINDARVSRVFVMENGRCFETSPVVGSRCDPQTLQVQSARRRGERGGSWGHSRSSSAVCRRSRGGSPTPDVNTRSRISSQLSEYFSESVQRSRANTMRVESFEAFELINATGIPDDISDELDIAGGGSVSAVAIKEYLRGFGGPSYIALLVFAMLCFPAANVVNNWWLSVWVNDDQGHNSSDFYVYVYLGIGVATALLTLARNWLFVIGVVRAAKHLHDRLLHTVIHQSCMFFDSQPMSRITNRFVKDMTTVDESVPSALNYLTQTSLTLLATMIIVAWVTPFVLLALVLIIVPTVIVAQYFRWSARDLRRMQSAARSPLLTFLHETVAGIAIIRTQGQRNRFMERFFYLVDDINRFAWHNLAATQWVTVWLEFTGALIVLACSLLTVYGQRSGLITSGQAGLALTYVIQLPGMIGWFLKEISQAEVEAIAVERCFEYTQRGITSPPRMDAPDTSHSADEDNDDGMAGNDGNSNSSVVEGRGDGTSAIDQHLSAHIPVDAQTHAPGALVMDRVSLSYSKDAATVLSGVSCFIPAGAKVAVVGPSGAGKSTLFLALLRMYPSTGRVCISGSDMGNVSATQLRRKYVTLVPQVPALFGDTIRAVIAGPDADAASTPDIDARVWRVLHAVGLGQRVSALPQGLETPMTRAAGVSTTTDVDGEDGKSCAAQPEGQSENRISSLSGAGVSLEAEEKAPEPTVSRKERAGQGHGKRLHSVGQGSKATGARCGSRTGHRDAALSDETTPLLASSQTHGSTTPASTTVTATTATLTLSAGERQLLSLARALYRPTPLLLCDEITSSVDAATDKAIHDIILSVDATVLSICHRLAHVSRFDLVMVMDGGKLVELGPPSSFSHGSLFHRLLRQAGLA